MAAVAPAETPLIERGRELELLRQAWLDAQGGQGRLILVDGASGIGKTRLLAELGAVAAPNPVLLRARGSELECDLAYGIVRQLLERWLLELPAGERAQALAGPAAEAVSAFGAKTSARTSGRQIDHGLYWLIANLAQAAPVILAVDDAQWTDPASLRFLGYLARRLKELPAVLVMAAGGGVRDYRSWALTELAAGDDASRLELGPLSQAGTARLATALSRGAIGPGALLACHRSTGGNPFLIRELVFAVEQSGRPLSAAAVSELTEHGADSLTRAVMLRLGSLGADAIAVAAAVAVLDPDSQLHLVGSLSGLDVGAVAAAADRLAGARILADTLPLSFAHPLLRGAVYGDLTAVKRERLHREAAQLLRDAGAPAERVAMQLLATEPSQDPQVAEFLLSAAADAAAVGAAASAARYLGRALLEPPDDNLLGDVLLRLGLAEAGTGDTLGARSHLQAALDVLSESNARVEAGLILARVTLEAEGPIEAVRALEHAAAGVDGEAALRLELERELLELSVPQAAASAARAMKRHATLAGVTATERLALANAALAVTFDPTASAAQALGLARRALADGALIAEQTADSPHWVIASSVLHQAEDLGGAERQATLAFDDARARGSSAAAAAAALSTAQLAMLRGELTDAIAHSEMALAHAHRLPADPITTRALRAGPAVVLVSALVAAGALDRARAVIAQTPADGELGSPELCPIDFASGLVKLAAGDARSALGHFHAYQTACERLGYEDRQLPWRLAAARAELAVGNRAAATRLVDAALVRARAWGAPGGVGAALRVHALTADPEPRCALLADAVQALRQSPCRLELAGALVDRGIALRAAGSRRAAREALEEGVDIATRCGADPLVTQALAELHVLGARPRRLMFSGVEGLTASERRVAALATEGMTNRQIAQALFITRKTVENHLASTYRKLDISSRRELPREIAQTAS